MAETRTVIAAPINEGSTPKITGVLKNKAGAAIPVSQLTTLTLPLYNIDDTAYPIINSRDNQDVKNTNRCTIDESGNLAWTLAPEDAVIKTPSALTLQKPYETHRAVFKWTYTEDSLSQVGSHIIEFKVRNLEKVS